MARLIDANALLAEYDRQHKGEPGKARKLIEDAPTVAAVPVSELLSLRDNLYEDNLITMRGLRDLNMLIAKYEGGKEKERSWSADELETCQTIPEVAQKTRNQEDMQSKQL